MLVSIDILVATRPFPSPFFTPLADSIVGATLVTCATPAPAEFGGKTGHRIATLIWHTCPSAVTKVVRVHGRGAFVVARGNTPSDREVSSHIVESECKNNG